MEKTADEANVAIPGTLKPVVTANNSTESNSVVREYYEDQTLVIEVTLGAAEDGREDDNAMVSAGDGVASFPGRVFSPPSRPGNEARDGGDRGGYGDDRGVSDSESCPIIQ